MVYAYCMANTASLTQIHYDAHIAINSPDNLIEKNTISDFAIHDKPYIRVLFKLTLYRDCSLHDFLFYMLYVLVLIGRCMQYLTGSYDMLTTSM